MDGLTINNSRFRAWVFLFLISICATTSWWWWSIIGRLGRYISCSRPISGLLLGLFGDHLHRLCYILNDDDLIYDSVSNEIRSEGEGRGVLYITEDIDWDINWGN